MRSKLTTAGEVVGAVLVLGGAFVMSLAFGCVVLGAVVFAAAQVADQ